MSEEHHTNYAKIFWTLMVLFVISVVGPELPWPEDLKKTMILITAFGIAVVKAIIVAGWFMHLAHERKYIWYAFITSLAFLFLFVVAVAPDVTMTKGTNWESQIPWEAEAQPAEGKSEASHDDSSHH
jgi:caa(3)-type oxidase subunit IV